MTVWLKFSLLPGSRQEFFNAADIKSWVEQEEGRIVLRFYDGSQKAVAERPCDAEYCEVPNPRGSMDPAGRERIEKALSGIKDLAAQYAKLEKDRQKFKRGNRR